MYPASSKRGIPSKLLHPALLLPFLALVLGSAPVDAQTLKGRVSDGTSKQFLTSVTVSLLDPEAVVLDTMRVDPQGKFEFSVPGPGEYYVRAERDRYTTVTDGIFVFEREDGLMEIALFMNPQPVVLEGIDVRVERETVRRKLRTQGFYERAATGFGRFIGPEELENRVLFQFGDILRGIPGVSFSDEIILFRSFGTSGTCEPNVYVDGSKMVGTQGLKTLIPDDVQAVEVYRGVAQTPMQWGGLNGSCGAIVIWTKEGR